MPSERLSLCGGLHLRNECLRGRSACVAWIQQPGLLPEAGNKFGEWLRLLITQCPLQGVSIQQMSTEIRSALRAVASPSHNPPGKPAIWKGRSMDRRCIRAYLVDDIDNAASRFTQGSRALIAARSKLTWRSQCQLHPPMAPMSFSLAPAS